MSKTKLNFITDHKTQLAILKKLRKHFSKTFYFCKVTDVFPHYADDDTPPLVVKFDTAIDKHVLEDMDDIESGDSIELDDNKTAIFPPSFTCFGSLVDEDGKKSLPVKSTRFDERQVLLNSETFSDLDPVRMEYVPRHFTACRVPLPVEGDIIACLPTQESMKDTSKPLIAEKWFVCSFQFFRLHALFTSSVYHPLFRKHKNNLFSLREELMRGSQLSTNGYLKRYIATLDNNLPFDHRDEKTASTFKFLRTEIASVDYVHIYPALAMFLFFGLKIDDSNVPKNKDTDINMKHWHIPPGFVGDVMNYWIAK